MAKKNRRDELIGLILLEDTKLCPLRFRGCVEHDADQKTQIWNRKVIDLLNKKHLVDMLNLIMKEKQHQANKEFIESHDVDREMIIKAINKVEIHMLPGDQMRILGTSDETITIYAFDLVGKTMHQLYQDQLMKAKKIMEEKRIATPEDGMLPLTQIRKLETAIELCEEFKAQIAFVLRDKMKAQYAKGNIEHAAEKKIIPAGSLTVIK